MMLNIGLVLVVMGVILAQVAYWMRERTYRFNLKILKIVLGLLEDREEWPGPRQRNERARLYLRRVLGLPTALDGEEKTGGVNP